MKIQLLFYLFVVFISCVSCAPNPPPTWGGRMQWSCSVNITSPEVMKMTANWTFEYHYDWTLTVDRYDHEKGQHDQLCYVKGIPVGEPCSVINRPDGTAYVFSQNYCCVFPVKVGAVRYDWVESSNGTQVGTQVINGIESDVWTAKGASVNYFAQSNDGYMHPVRYWEYITHLKGALKKWDFLLETFVDSAPPTNLFIPPSNCTNECIFLG